MHTHTYLSSWNWAPVAGSGRLALGSLWATHMFRVWSKSWLANNCLQHICYLIFAELTDRDKYTTLLLDKYNTLWCREQAGTAKDLVFPVPLPHGMEDSATLHSTFHQLLGPQFFRAALQGPVVWNRNVFSEFYTEFPSFGWMLCGTYTCTCTIFCVLALGRGITPLYPVATLQLSRDLCWASVSPWLWKDHRGVPLTCK